jgi:hypothetical protein
LACPPKSARGFDNWSSTNNGEALELIAPKSVVFDDVNGDDHWATEIRQLISRSPGSGVLVNTLIARKRVLFGEDRRLIGEYKVTFEQGRFTLRAARAPQSRP